MLRFDGQVWWFPGYGDIDQSVTPGWNDIFPDSARFLDRNRSAETRRAYEQSVREDQRRQENLRILLENLGRTQSPAAIRLEMLRMAGVTTTRDAQHIIQNRIPGQHNHCRCPSCGSKYLSVLVQPDSKILLNCHKGCPTRDVLHAMSLCWSDLRPPCLPG